MRRTPLAVVVAGALILALRGAPALAADAAPTSKTPAQESAAAADAKVPLYTNADLERMFGPPSPEATAPVVNTTPDDWSWVQSFLDREYARIDADRSYDLTRKSLGCCRPAARTYFGYPAAWSLGYPASVWWNTVHRAYRKGLRPQDPPRRR